MHRQIFCNPVGARKVRTRRRKRRPIGVRKKAGGEVRELNARLIRKLAWPQNPRRLERRPRKDAIYPTNDAFRSRST